MNDEAQIPIQLIRGNTYSFRGRRFQRGKTVEVSPVAARYFLEKKNPRGQRYFARVQINRVKEVTVEPDEVLIDLDDDPTDVVIHETRAVDTVGGEHILESETVHTVSGEDGSAPSPEALREEIEGPGHRGSVEPLSDEERLSLMGEPNIDDEDQVPI